MTKDLPAALDDVLARATELDPRRRFPSTAEFAHALLPFASARTRRLWVSRDARRGVFSAQLLSGVWRADEDSGELDTVSVEVKLNDWLSVLAEQDLEGDSTADILFFWWLP